MKGAAKEADRKTNGSRKHVGPRNVRLFLIISNPHAEYAGVNSELISIDDDQNFPRSSVDVRPICLPKASRERERLDDLKTNKRI